MLAYVSSCDPPVVKYLRLPSGGVPASSWEDDQLGLEHEMTSFSAYPEKNLLAVLEEWFDDDRWVTRSHVRPALLTCGLFDLTEYLTSG
jgi:hypothetical protein